MCLRDKSTVYTMYILVKDLNDSPFFDGLQLLQTDNLFHLFQGQIPKVQIFSPIQELLFLKCQIDLSSLYCLVYEAHEQQKEPLFLLMHLYLDNYFEIQAF
ncbi:hypothetical protein DSECCO2_653850 [anaerobic digester metagenome]